MGRGNTFCMNSPVAKWGNLDVENETGCGVVPYTYKEKNLVNAIQWAVGLELMLLINDPWRECLNATDHPNGAHVSGDILKSCDY